MTSKAGSTLWFLPWKLKNTSPQVKLGAYITLLRSQLKFAKHVWFTCAKSCLEKLQQTYTKAVALIFNKYRYGDSPTLLLQLLNLTSLSKRLKGTRSKCLLSLPKGDISIQRDKYSTFASTRPTTYKPSNHLVP